MEMAFTVVISLIMSRDRLSQGKIYQPSQHQVQIFTNSGWNRCLSIIWDDICSAPWSGGRERGILSLISSLVYLAYLALGFIYYANQKRTGEDTENTLLILKMAESPWRKKVGQQNQAGKGDKRDKRVWILLGQGLRKSAMSRKDVKENYPARRRLRWERRI